MCTPARRAGPYRTARRACGGARAAAAAPARRGAPRGRDPDREHAALPRRGLDAQVAAGQLRALAHAGDAEVAPAREVREVVRDLEARAVVGDRQHRAPAERPQADGDARRARIALGVAQRLAQDPLQLAGSDGVAARRRPRSRGRAARCCAAAQRSASDRSAVGQRQHGLVALGRRPRDDLARLARGLAGVRGQLRASATAPSGSRSIWRESASAAKPMPETVLASESCMSRASRERSASAAMWRSCAASGLSASAWRSSSRRAPAPAAAAIGYSSGWPRSVRKFDGTGSTPARTEIAQ